MDHLPGTHFFTLVTDSNEDTRQNQYVALLEQQPQTEEAARKLLRSIHHRDEWADRQFHKRHVPMVTEPVDTTLDRPIGEMEAALELLPEEDRWIIQQHIINRLSLRELGDELGVSKDTIDKRYKLAVEKLRNISK